MRNIYKVIALLIIATLILVGCSSDNPEPVKPDNEEIAHTEDGDKVTEEDDDKEFEEEVIDSNNEIKSKVLQDLFNAKRYTMELKQTTSMNDITTSSLVTNVVADGDTYSHSNFGGIIMEIIEMGDNAYLIMHDTNMVIKTNRHDELEPGETGTTLVYDDLKYLGKGKEMFLDNNRSYEEYGIELGSVKYYFDGNKLDGMKVVFDMEKLFEDDEDEAPAAGEAIMIIDVLSFTKDVDMSLFELPEDYQVVGG